MPSKNDPPWKKSFLDFANDPPFTFLLIKRGDTVDIRLGITYVFYGNILTTFSTSSQTLFSVISGQDFEMHTIFLNELQSVLGMLASLLTFSFVQPCKEKN